MNQIEQRIADAALVEPGPEMATGVRELIADHHARRERIWRRTAFAAGVMLLISATLNVALLTPRDKEAPASVSTGGTAPRLPPQEVYSTSRTLTESGYREVASFQVGEQLEDDSWQG